MTIKEQQRFVLVVVWGMFCALGYPETSIASPEDHAEQSIVPQSSVNTTPIIIRGTETFSAEFIGDNGPLNEGAYGDDDNFWQFRNIFYLQSSIGDFDTGIRFDTVLFHNPPSAVPFEEFSWGETANGYTLLNYNHDFRLERIHGGFRVGHLTVTLGDFYTTFGKGIALALIKVDDVGLDTGLLGGRASYRIGNTLELKVLGGVVNALNVDPITHQVLEDDPLDRLAGARLDWRISDNLTIAGHGVLLVPRYTDEAQIQDDRLYVDRSPGVAARNIGGSIELNIHKTNFYVEANYQRHDNYRPPEGMDDVLDEPGYALFGEIRQLIGDHELVLEGYYYRQWLMDGPYRGSAPNIALTQSLPYQKMITLELPWMPVKSLGNATAGRASWLRYIQKSKTELNIRTLLISNQGGLTPQGDWSDHADIRAVHPIGHVDQTFGTTGLHLLVEGGYRYEWTPSEESKQGTLWHVSADLTIPLTGAHSLSAVGGLRRHKLDLTESGDPYWVSMGSLGYNYSGVVAVTVLHEYSDQTEGAESKLGDWKLPLPRHHYLSIVVNYYPPKPLDGISLGLRAGSQRGGHKCAGGVCREFPDSVGAKLEATYRF